MNIHKHFDELIEGDLALDPTTSLKWATPERIHKFKTIIEIVEIEEKKIQEPKELETLQYIKRICEKLLYIYTLDKPKNIQEIINMNIQDINNLEQKLIELIKQHETQTKEKKEKNNFEEIDNATGNKFTKYYKLNDPNRKEIDNYLISHKEETIKFLKNVNKYIAELILSKVIPIIFGDKENNKNDYDTLNYNEKILKKILNEPSIFIDLINVVNNFNKKSDINLEKRKKIINTFIKFLIYSRIKLFEHRNNYCDDYILIDHPVYNLYLEFIKEKSIDKINIKEFSKYIMTLNKENILGNYNLGDYVFLKKDKSKIYQIFKINSNGYILTYDDYNGRQIDNTPYTNKDLILFHEYYDWKKVEKLREENVLVLHSTITEYSERKNPIQNIINNINESKTKKPYTLSCFSISPKYRNKLPIINKGKYMGQFKAIGNVISKGEIYQAFSKDGYTEKNNLFDEYVKPKNKQEIKPVRIAITSRSCNELNIKKWKIDGVFYTKNAPEELKQQIRSIAINYNLKLFEIDSEKNTWEIMKYNNKELKWENITKQKSVSQEEKTGQRLKKLDEQNTEEQINPEEYERRKNILINEYNYKFEYSKTKELNEILIRNWEDTQYLYERLHVNDERNVEFKWRLLECFGAETSSRKIDPIKYYSERPKETFNLIINAFKKRSDLSGQSIMYIFQFGVPFLIDKNIKEIKSFKNNPEKAINFLLEICKFPKEYENEKYNHINIVEPIIKITFHEIFPELFGGVKRWNRNSKKKCEGIKPFKYNPKKYMREYFENPEEISKKLLEPIAEELKIPLEKLLYEVKQGLGKVEKEENHKYIEFEGKAQDLRTLNSAFNNRIIFEELKKENKEIPLILYKERNIILYPRYGITSENLLKEYQNLNDNKKPFGVIIYAKFDHNTAFQKIHKLNKLISDLEKLKYIPRIIEVKNAFEIYKILRKLKRKYNKEISFLILQVHGRINTMRFSEEQQHHFTSDEQFFPKNKNSKLWQKISETISPTAQIVSFGCSTGANKGIMQKISEYLPNRICTGPDIPTAEENTEVFLVNKENKENIRFEVYYDRGAKTMTYYNGHQIKNLKKGEPIDLTPINQNQEKEKIMPKEINKEETTKNQRTKPETIYDINKVIKTMQNKNYKIFTEPFKANIVGVRTLSPLDIFNDTLIVFWYDKQNNIYVKQYRFTTDPGAIFLEGDNYLQINEKGVAILKEGQYIDVYKLGWHNGGKKQILKSKLHDILNPIVKQTKLINKDISSLKKAQQALIQVGEFAVYRDNDGNGILTLDENNLEKGIFNINIHRANHIGITEKVDKNSAGCQVFADVRDYKEFFKLIKGILKSKNNRYTYTLLRDKEIN